jgi:large subunit ribosomal protein L10
MHRSEKERLVEELTERLKATETLIVADYRGLTVTEIDELRGKLIEQGARFTVVKNTLTKRAAEAAGVDALLALLDGPTAIAFLESGGDPVAVAKALDDAGKTEVLVIRGGLLEGEQIGADDVKRLAKLPPVDTLRAQLVGALAGSLTTIVGLFAAPMRDLVGVIDARIKQLEEQGETAEAPEDAKAEAEPAEEPAAEEPAAEEPPAEEAASEEPAAEEPSADEAASEEPAAEAAAPEEPEPNAPAEEPAQEAPTPEEPAAEAPAAEEPATEEPAAEEPAADEPVEETQEGEQQ